MSKKIFIIKTSSGLVPADAEAEQEDGTKEEEKRCKTCGAMKPLSGYYKAREAADGHFGSCRLCMNKQRWKNKQNAVYTPHVSCSDCRTCLTTDCRHNHNEAVKWAK